MSARALVVAHGAGNCLARLRAAAPHADLVEADVHRFAGRLEVRHAKTLGPLPVLWERWRLVPRARPPLVLEELMGQAPPEVRLVLDLKGPDPRLAAEVMAAARSAGRAEGLVVSARVWRTADRLGEAPGVTALHSAGGARQVRALLRRYRPERLGGVAVHRRLLTPGVAAALRERAPWLWTWPVDDPADARRLEAWGVTGLISDAPERLHALRSHSLVAPDEEA